MSEPVFVVITFNKIKNEGEVIAFDKNDDVVEEWEFFDLPELIQIFDEVFSKFDVADVEVAWKEEK